MKVALANKDGLKRLFPHEVTLGERVIHAEGHVALTVDHGTVEVADVTLITEGEGLGLARELLGEGRGGQQAQD